MTFVLPRTAKQSQYTGLPEDVRARLHERLKMVVPADPAETRLDSSQPSGLPGWA